MPILRWRRPAAPGSPRREIEAVGRDVTSFLVGDRVFEYSGLQHGSRFGAHAEYLAMPEDGSLATMPANLTYEQAAPGTEGAHYALTGIRTAKIQRGHDVLVYGATGAIGSAAAQLSKSLGAPVTAVCDTEHLELVRGLGPLNQNLVLVLITPLVGVFGGKKVLFRFRGMIRRWCGSSRN
jgi:NADPH:quinone reductase-like Zn-dependent oxidoreductase